MTARGGARDGALPWVVAGNAAAIVDGSPYQGIVVMPQCGKACWFSKTELEQFIRARGVQVAA